MNGRLASKATNIIALSWCMRMSVPLKYEYTATSMMPKSFNTLLSEQKASAKRISENVIVFNGKKTNFTRRKKLDLFSTPGNDGIMWMNTMNR
jgi:hypothetical protein